jgi:hypothetical protein
MNSNLALIPPTTRETYLTGQVALNIPAPEGTCGDWHALALFNRNTDLSRFRGGGAGMFVNTNPLFGDTGIHECSTWFLDRNHPVTGPVYAANHYRAIIDIIIDCWKNGITPASVSFNDYITEEHHQKQFWEMIANKKHLFPASLETAFKIWEESEKKLEANKYSASNP